MRLVAGVAGLALALYGFVGLFRGSIVSIEPLIFLRGVGLYNHTDINAVFVSLRYIAMGGCLLILCSTWNLISYKLQLIRYVVCLVLLIYVLYSYIYMIPWKL